MTSEILKAKALKPDIILSINYLPDAVLMMRTLYEQKVENTYRSWLQSLRGDSHIENRL